MIILPLHTDAPIYHRPVVTISLISGMLILGIAAFLGVPPLLEPVLDILKSLPLLKLGQFSGLIFLISVLFQLPFLWIFGQVVEGKIGAIKFLLVLAINIGLLVGTTWGLSLIYPPFWNILITGPIIYSLVGISLIWAPKNEVLMLFGVFFFAMRSIMFELTIYTFAMWFMLMEIGLMMFALVQTSWSVEIINFIGVIYGAMLGTIMLKYKMVDCENWDIFSVSKGKNLKTIAEMNNPEIYAKKPAAFVERGKKKKKKKRFKTRDNSATITSSGSGWEIKKADDQQETKLPAANKKNKPKLKKSNTGDRKALLSKIQEQLDAGKPNAAYSELQEIMTRLPGFKLPAPMLLDLSQALFKAGHYKQVVPLYEEYLEHFPEEAAEIRLRLAGIMIEKQQRPSAGLRVIKSIPPNSLSESHDEYRISLIEKGLQMIEDGVIEFEGGGI